MDLTAITGLFGIDLVQITGTASVIMLLVAAIKKMIPTIQGKITVFISIGLCLLFSVLTQFTKGVDSIFIAAIIMFIETTGAFELIKKAGGSGGSK